MTDLKLSYDVRKLLAVEEHLKRPISDIVSELRSDAGASLTTLVTLLAAGRMSPMPSVPAFMLMDMEVRKAPALIERHGLATVVKVVGESLGSALARLSEGR